MKVTEENFITLAKNGNEKALDYIISKYGFIVKTVVKKHLYNIPWYSDECMNDVLLAVWENIGKYDPNAGTFKNWVAGVARYTSLNYLRKYKKEIEQVLYDESVLAATKLDTTIEADEAFLELISHLNEQDRQLFTKIFKENMSLEQISEQQNMSKSVLYNRISRAKQKIKKFL